MGIAERKLREREAVRTLILDASWDIVQKQGWQALSMRRLAEAIEYSAPVIYSHFSGKEAIQEEFARRGFRLLNEALSEAIKGVVGPEAQITALAAAYFHFGVTHRPYYELMYGLGMPSCEKVREIPELSTFTGILLEPIEALVARASLPETDAITKMRSLWSMLHGLVSIRLMDFHAGKDTSREVLGDLVTFFVRGIQGEEKRTGTKKHSNNG